MTQHIRLAGALALLLSSQACAESPQPVPAPKSFGTPGLTEPKEPLKPDVRRAIKRTLDTCIKEVRTALPNDTFDAYLEGSGVNYLATKEAEFQFQKCMSENGYPISAQ
jgi:hypothetical protein